MSMPSDLREVGGVRVAVEGCGHGTLDAIYASVDASCAQRGWHGVDLVIIGGDFQATRNAADLTVMSVPIKYRAMGDFHMYYSGHRKAPYLTVFVGGNHEAAGYLWELFYGGWVAPNIYYMGAANVLRLGPLRIAGMSGIWKGVDYRRPHHERLPFRQDDIKSFYHVRESDVRKLLLIREPVDIGVSHDWPRGIEWHGDAEHLFRIKPHFRRDATEGSLGSVAAEYVLDRLRPRYWFSAHLHCKFAAVKQFSPPPPVTVTATATAAATSKAQLVASNAKASFSTGRKLELPLPTKQVEVANPDEIDLDDDDDGNSNKPAAIDTSAAPVAAQQPVEAETVEPQKDTPAAANSNVDGVPSELLAQLPASFQRPQHQQRQQKTVPGQPVPPTITNTRVDFLALDKCLPGRHFLQLIEIGNGVGEVDTHPPTEKAGTAETTETEKTEGNERDEAVSATEGDNVPLEEAAPRFQLEYDPEWLAITRVFAKDLVVGEKNYAVPPDLGEENYRPLIDAERAWVDENIVAKGRLVVPTEFAQTAPVHEPVPGQPETYSKGQPDEFTNPHTTAFCALLEVPNIWHATDQERSERKQLGLSASSPRRHGSDWDDDRESSGHYGGRGRGGGRGRWGGGRGGGRGYNRGDGRGRARARSAY